MAIRHIHTHTLHMANGTPPKLVVNSSETQKVGRTATKAEHQNCKSRKLFTFPPRFFCSLTLSLVNPLSLPLQSYQLVFSCCLFSANSQLIATTVAAAASRQQAFFFSLSFPKVSMLFCTTAVAATFVIWFCPVGSLLSFSLYCLSPY